MPDEEIITSEKSKLDYAAQYDIFISYRRDGGEAMAILLRDRLAERGYRVFLDIENLNSGSFNKKLFDVIDNCVDFVLIGSIGSLDRCANEGDWVRMEIARALDKKKNIVPIMLRGFEFPETLPEEIEPIRMKNGINASVHEYFDAALDRLINNFLKSRPTFDLNEMSEKLQSVIREGAASKKKKSKKTSIILIAILVVLIGGYFFFSNGYGDNLIGNLGAGNLGTDGEKSSQNAALNAEILIRNDTENEIHSVYLKRSDNSDWGENLVSGGLPAGETLTAKVPKKETDLTFSWDLRSVFYFEEAEETTTFTLEGFSLFEVTEIVIYVNENGEYEREFVRG